MDVEDWEPGKAAAIGGISDLLQSSAYSDLTLEIDGKVFKVHKAVLCPRSAVFRIECDGRFNGSSYARIKTGAPTADVATIERMLSYLYSHQYDDGSRSANGAEPLMSLRVEDLVERTSSLTIVNEHGDSASASNAGDDDLDQGTEQHRGTLGKSRAEEQIDVLLANIHVYCVADYYDIGDLKDLALSKFKEGLTRQRSSTFAEIVRTGYTFTPETDALRGCILDRVVLNRHHFGKDRKFIEGVLQVDGFMTDFSIQATETYEKDITNVTTEMIQRTTTLEQEKTDLVRDKNQLASTIKDLERHEKQSEGIMSLFNSMRKCGNCERSINILVHRNDAPLDWKLQCWKCKHMHRPLFREES